MVLTEKRLLSVCGDKVDEMPYLSKPCGALTIG
jgi:hypothetical protein